MIYVISITLVVNDMLRLLNNLSIIILILSSANKVFADDSLCKVHIYLINTENFELLYINESEEFIYEDTIGLDSSTFTYNCIEPKYFSIIINNDPTNLIPIYIHSGEFNIYIDMKDYTYYFNNSELNTLNIQLLKKEDSLRKKMNVPTSFELYKSAFTNIDKDSMILIMKNFNNERAKMNYKYFKKHPNSYLALNFIWIQLRQSFFSKEKLLFSKKKLLNIFSKIPIGFNQYKTYKECLDLFKTPHKFKEIIAKPLWNGK